MTKAEIAAKAAADNEAKLAADKLAAEQAAAAEAEAAKKAAEPQSAKLTELRATLAAEKLHVKTLAADSKEEDESFTKIYKLGEDIKTEIAEIGRQKAAAEQKERESKIAAEFDDAVQASKDNDAVQASDATMEDKNASNANYQSLREAIVNKLLGKAKPISGGTGTATGATGATSKAILDLIIANRAAGMNDADNKKAVIAAGYATGTIWGILDKFKKENGAKA